MTLYKYIYCVVILLSFILQISAAGCEINPFITHAAILVNPSNTTFIYPKHGEKVIRIETGDTIEFACPQKHVVIDGRQLGALVEATCIFNTKFSIDGEQIFWGDVHCNANPIATARYTSSNCGTNARWAKIGFDLGNSRFLKTITVCFDTENEIALYSYYVVPSSIAARLPLVPRPQFWQDNEFYDVDPFTVNQLYVRGKQRSTINGLLGLSANSVKYIEAGIHLYLARGHFAARADFIYPTEQNASFRYINAAPQWQSFNENNWEQVEIDSRDYADNHNVNLQIWTGSYGVATLPHEHTGEEIQLSLFVEDDRRALPVPALYWKLVYEPLSKKGIVLIGLNNPYESNVSKHIICPDVSAQVSWLQWDKTNITAGYSYACTIAKFRKVVTYAPNLSVSGLLL